MMKWLKIFLEIFKMAEKAAGVYNRRKRQRGIEKIKKNPGGSWNDKFSN